jgi:hypothetical protein
MRYSDIVLDTRELRVCICCAGIINTSCFNHTQEDNICNIREQHMLHRKIRQILPQNL